MQGWSIISFECLNGSKTYFSYASSYVQFNTARLLDILDVAKKKVVHTYFPPLTLLSF